MHLKSSDMLLMNDNFNCNVSTYTEISFWNVSYSLGLENAVVDQWVKLQMGHLGSII